VFASPFVVTFACRGAPPEPPPSPPPARSVERAPVDASAPDAPAIWFADPYCEHLEADGGRARVECPDDLLPEAEAGELVVSPTDVGDDTRGHCFRVYERKLGTRTSRYHWDEGRVRCPPGGPNVELPPKLTIPLGRDRYRLDAESLQCYREVMANPPYWTKASCPQELTPKLVGLQPDAPCMYRGIQVNCVTATGKGKTARVLAVQVVANGVEIVIGVGSKDGLAKGMRVLLKGHAGPGEITSCSERACRVVITGATPDQVRAHPTVEIQ
jgi:hypothetical protein